MTKVATKVVEGQHCTISRHIDKLSILHAKNQVIENSAQTDMLSHLIVFMTIGKCCFTLAPIVIL